MSARGSRAGHITREASPADRRSLLVALTERGAEAWSSTIGDQRHTEEAMLDALDDAERDTLAALLRKLAEAAEAEGGELMPPPD